MWNVLRIAYFDQGKAALLLGPVSEAIAHLRDRDGIEAVMLNSHWKFGPHVDIGVKCAAPVFDAVFPECERMIGEWLTAHPSTTMLDPAEYEVLSTKLAVAELEAPPFVPLLENNSVTRAEYQRSRAINLPQLVDSKEEFLAASTDLLLSLTALKTDDSELAFIVLILMMAAIAKRFKPDGIKRGYVSYRSHAEYFFDNYDKTNVLRPKMDALDVRYRERIDGNLKLVVEGAFGSLDLPPQAAALVVEWERIVDEVFTRNQRIIEENHDELVADTETTTIEDNFNRLAGEITKDIPEQYHLDPEKVGRGAVVDAVMQHQEGRDMFRSADFIAYRTTVNFFYMLLPILDISPAKKFMLCHLVANSVERVFSISWRDWVPDAANGAEMT